MKTLINFVKNLKTFYQFYRDYEYDGNDCRFIIENYQEVLCNRTKTMSKPTMEVLNLFLQKMRTKSKLQKNPIWFATIKSSSILQKTVLNT